MPSITFDLETVTPLFLSGAEQQKAELRPPAFRGALRYWFRAIAGAYYWNNPHKIKEIESDLLGDSGAHGSSKIILRLSKFGDIESKEVEFNKGKEGIKYLWFSLFQKRQALGFDEPVRFSLTLSTRPKS